jgi:hypothetical protein
LYFPDQFKKISTDLQHPRGVPGTQSRAFTSDTPSSGQGRQGSKAMNKLLISILVTLFLLSACSQEGVEAPLELSAFIEELKDNGLDGSLTLRGPVNEDMEYVAEYAIAKYSSTRIISLFKCKDAEKAAANLAEALKNPKLSGQASNGTFIMAATFYPPDEKAVEKIKAIFLAHEFE